MRLSDLLPAFTTARGGIDFHDTPEKQARRERDAIEKQQAEARWNALHEPLRQATDGLLRRLVDMHRPNVVFTHERPTCDYCTSHDFYGRALPLWPCPEIRVIAAEVGVELPPEDDD